MPRKLSITSLVVVITLVVTLLVAYAQPLKNAWLARRVENNISSLKAANLQPANGTDVEIENTGNLSRQPEAAKLRRRLGGERFKSRTGPTLIMQGQLKTDGDSQQLTIVRRQTADGERVEVNLAGGRGSLVWARESGPQNSSGGKVNQAERTLLERLTSDSADEFLLAQLRGAGRTCSGLLEKN